MEYGKIYFYTVAITHWRNLLEPNQYKNIIIDCLAYLVKKQKIHLYGFAIMPNHIHFIWEMIEANGKEMPHASFMKYTAHKIQQDLKANHSQILEEY